MAFGCWLLSNNVSASIPLHCPVIFLLHLKFSSIFEHIESQIMSVFYHIIKEH